MRDCFFVKPNTRHLKKMESSTRQGRQSLLVNTHRRCYYNCEDRLEMEVHCIKEEKWEVWLVREGFPGEEVLHLRSKGRAVY